ncbi:MAG: chorismate mutase [Pseudomonadota bacterium]|nr:chorismate mutase [Pseudomonadota bacterium]
MDDNKAKPEDIRHEIERIDERIHEDLIHRAELMSRLESSRPKGNARIDPAIEAEMLHRLALRHRGQIPVAAFLRLWREIVCLPLDSDSAAMSVAVYAPNDGPGLWDLARDHFGGFVNLIGADSPIATIRLMGENNVQAVVVPWPLDEDRDAWWPNLSGAQEDRPRIVARLPVFSGGNARAEEQDALVIAWAESARTGHDRTLIVLEMSDDVSRGRLAGLIKKADLNLVRFHDTRRRSGGNDVSILIEVEGFVERTDARFKKLAEILGDACVAVGIIGTYPLPEMFGVKNKE